MRFLKFSLALASTALIANSALASQYTANCTGLLKQNTPQVTNIISSVEMSIVTDVDDVSYQIKSITGSLKLDGDSFANVKLAQSSSNERLFKISADNSPQPGTFSFDGKFTIENTAKGSGTLPNQPRTTYYEISGKLTSQVGSLPSHSTSTHGLLTCTEHVK